jgi:hypothetical protein
MPEPELQEDEEITAEEIREEIMALTEALEVIDDPEDRAVIESEIDALNQALEFIE